jgi:NADPH:quinone reductase-like Zn-dependent oxidoreductase
MRSLGICSSDFAGTPLGNTSLGSLDIEGVTVHCGITESAMPAFAPDAEHRRHVLLRVKAFSCNYRDKSLILRMAVSGRSRAFYAVGSEFVAEVVAAGAEVDDLKPGDRVMGNNAYPDSGVPGVLPGVPTNHASHEFLVLHGVKVMPVPAMMTDAVAAAFSIGAQTTYSMIRRLGIGRGERVLVTAAKSNTSLFALVALGRLDVELYALSTSDREAAALAALGVKELIVFDPRGEAALASHPAVARVLARGGFDAVIDPYFDLYLPHLPPVMANGGRYTTCGLYDQYLSLVGREPSRPKVPLGHLPSLVVFKNLSLIGNCIGLSADLERATADHAAGHLPVRIDSVFGGQDAVGFLARTYNASDRFGKVVFAYD